MNRLRFIVLIFGAIMASVICLATYVYKTEDSIGKAHWDTVLILQKYNWGLTTEERVTEWLTKYHGEAPDHQVMINFASFGISNPDRFLKVLQKLPTDSKNGTIDRIVFAATDAGLEQKFISAFGFEIQELKTKLAH